MMRMMLKLIFVPGVKASRFLLTKPISSVHMDRCMKLPTRHINVSAFSVELVIIVSKG